MAPKIVDKEKRREEILAAAFEVFGRKGYHATTLSEIARACGIGQGTLYYYFPTKEEIFWGVYDAMMSQMEAFVRQRLSSLQTPQARLESLIQGIFESFPEVRPSWLDGEAEQQWQLATSFSQVLMEFWLQAERTGRREGFYQRIVQQQRGMIALIMQVLSEVGLPLSEGVDLETVAHILVALRDGLGFQLRMGTISKDSAMLDKIRALLLMNIRRAP